MTMTVFAYLILIRVNFYDFKSLFSQPLGLVSIEVIYQTRETVFHRDIQTLRHVGRELKIRRAAEFFDENRGVWIADHEHCLDCLIYLLNRNKN